jgi:hypothetical protein
MAKSTLLTVSCIACGQLLLFPDLLAVYQGCYHMDRLVEGKVEVWRAVKPRGTSASLS